MDTNMVTKRHNPGTCCYVDPACLKITGNSKPSKTAEKPPGQPVLYYFMCRWTCSRCWKMAMMLGRMGNLLMDHNIAVVLVGNSHYLQPATHLAAKLKLRFTLLGDDANALKCAYGLYVANRPDHGQAMLLLDGHGNPFFCQDNLENRLALDLPGLISAIKTLPKVDLTDSRKLTC